MSVTTVKEKLMSEVADQDGKCVGSGSSPDVFEDVAAGTRFFTCSVCGSETAAESIVSDH
jgi:hypothetical protein